MGKLKVRLQEMGQPLARVEEQQGAEGRAGPGRSLWEPRY